MSTRKRGLERVNSVDEYKYMIDVPKRLRRISPIHVTKLLYMSLDLVCDRSFPIDVHYIGYLKYPPREPLQIFGQ